MKIINKTTIHELEIKKSKFISIVYFVSYKNQVVQLLKETKTKYKNATHYCYAYVINNDKHCSDDGEPSKTAGIPILNILDKYLMNYTLVIVIRYYGGVKLGPGGLIRAYSSSAKEAIEKATLSNIIPGLLIKLTVPYDKQTLIENIYTDINIIKKDYNEEVSYLIESTKEDLNKLKIPYQIIENIFIKNTK